MQGSKKNPLKKNRINIFGLDLGWTSTGTWRLIHTGQIMYLRFRIKQQDYENGILTERIV